VVGALVAWRAGIGARACVGARPTFAPLSSSTSTSSGSHVATAARHAARAASARSLAPTVFLYAQPSRVIVRPIVLTPTTCPSASAQVAQCRASVASGSARNCARSTGYRAGPIAGGAPGRGRGAKTPVARRNRK